MDESNQESQVNALQNPSNPVTFTDSTEHLKLKRNVVKNPYYSKNASIWLSLVLKCMLDSKKSAVLNASQVGLRVRTLGQKVQCAWSYLIDKVDTKHYTNLRRAFKIRMTEDSVVIVYRNPDLYAKVSDDCLEAFPEANMVDVTEEDSRKTFSNPVNLFMSLQDKISEMISNPTESNRIYSRSGFLLDSDGLASMNHLLLETLPSDTFMFELKTDSVRIIRL